MDKQQALRRIPKMDQLLNEEEIQVLIEEWGREWVLSATREVLKTLREDLLQGKKKASDFCPEEIPGAVEAFLRRKRKYQLHPVVNATGVILHTNLGRARLSSEAADNVVQVSRGYSTLEYDTQTGQRGSRHDHLEEIFREITGAEAVMMVNNNAAATLLCLSAMGQNREVLVSRGELVEIGGSFRIPDIMELGGAQLREVGTTNKTSISDYRRAIGDETAMLLKVHTSNYQIVGFTKEADLGELVQLGRERNLPVVYDMGSGLLTSLAEYGIDEPDVKTGLATGIDVILFSGDKLLGGPQGGIIAGKKIYIDRMKAHPLARVVRVDKMTIAAMEATLEAYRNEQEARRRIPVLEMITVSKEELKERALNWSQAIKEQLPEQNQWILDIADSRSRIGGGTTPLKEMESYALTLEHSRWSCDEIEERLRNRRIPIITRKWQNRVYLDMRTLLDQDLPPVMEALVSLEEEQDG